MRDRGTYADSNLGLAPLAQLLARRAGVDCEALVRRRVMGPLANGARRGSELGSEADRLAAELLAVRPS